MNSWQCRERSTGGTINVVDGAWHLDIEPSHEPGHRMRRDSKTVWGTLRGAETVLANPRAAHRSDVEVLGVRLPVDLSLALRKAAKADGVSVSEEVRLAIDDRIRRRGQ